MLSGIWIWACGVVTHHGGQTLDLQILDFHLKTTKTALVYADIHPTGLVHSYLTDSDICVERTSNEPVVIALGKDLCG